MAKKVIVAYSNTGASAYYRIHIPYENLQIEGVDFLIQNTTESLTDFDAVVIEQPTQPDLIPYMEECKKNGVITVVETDDDYLAITPTNPIYKHYKEGKEYLDTYKTCLRLADYVHVSTPELKKAIVEQTGRSEESVLVFLNALDIKRYKDIPKHSSEGDKKILMWGGASNSHRESIMIVRPMIKKLLKDNIVTLISNEQWLSSVFDKHPNLRIIPYMSMDNYFRMPSLADVFLTPLSNDKFSESKSELKCLEAGIFGVPCVSSDMPCYRRFNELSDGGNLIGNWLTNITELLENSELYKSCSEKSLNAVLTTYNIENVNKERESFWKKILK